ncbi:MAG: sugar ABC transporter ATP-binding protein [Clostridiales bacterium]|nr:sugar ABC transporter ATP-binding protein [Clostridiales bacterium]
MNQTRPLLSMKGISKSFGATRALDDVHFDLKRGEVHALLGENGAGKSTLIKIMSGAIRPTRGTMNLEGAKYSPASPLEGRKMGISVIYQELNLAPHMTVEENIMLGQEWKACGFLRRKKMRQKACEVLRLVSHPEIAPDVPVRRLSVAARQIVEISRALLEKAKILIMDEPTSSLSGEDRHRLFRLIKQLKGQGVSIVYISHFLEEVQQVADRFSVLRDGKNVGSGQMEEISLDGIIQLMVGKKVREVFPRLPHEVGPVALAAFRLRGKRMQAEVSLSLHHGEILGLAGLVGSGRTEFLRALFGLDACHEGVLRIGKEEIALTGPRLRIDHGIGFLSEDRQGEGLSPGQSVADNITLSRLAPYSRFGFLRLGLRNKEVERWIQRMKIKAQSPGQSILTLSGGNQQKVALARLLHQEAKVLLLDEPTRGIDILSKLQVYQWMAELAAQGKAILFVSSYLPELLGVCDRIAVFYRGQLAEVRPVSEWNEQSLTAATTTGRTSAGLH